MMTHDEMIAVIQAMKDKKKIQVRSPLALKPKWDDCNGDFILPNFYLYDYRVKPEPREIYVNLYPDGEHLAYDQKRSDVFKQATRVNVKFREVIEE